MRFILTTALICVFFGVSYSQTDRMVEIGLDKDGDMWLMNLDHIGPTTRNRFISAIQVKLNTETTMAMIMEFDCSNRKARFIKSLLYIQSVLFREDKQPEIWGITSGITGKALDIVCKDRGRRPVLPLDIGGKAVIN